LITASKDKEAFVRRGAAVALGQIKDAHAVEPLIAALKDENASVRRSAAAALGEIKDVRAAEPLIDALKRDENTGVIQNAAVALGELKDARAVNALLIALDDKRLDILAAVYTFFIRRGEPGTEDILIQVLNEYGSAGMVEDFVDCDNSKLEKAAYLWANVKGYTLRHLPSGRGKPVWGQEK